MDSNGDDYFRCRVFVDRITELSRLSIEEKRQALVLTSPDVFSHFATFESEKYVRIPDKVYCVF